MAQQIKNNSNRPTLQPGNCQPKCQRMDVLINVINEDHEHTLYNLSSPSTSESTVSSSEIQKQKGKPIHKDHQSTSYLSNAHSIFSKIYNPSRDQTRKNSPSPQPSIHNSSEKMSSAGTSPNLSTKNVKNSSFSSADSFLLWWRSSHSSPNASRSPSPNPSSSSSGQPAVTPSSRLGTIRSRSLSPILPSQQRTKHPHRLSEGKTSRNSSSTANFNNFLRQYFPSIKQSSKSEANQPKHRTIKRSKSASQDNICSIPIEIHHHLPPAHNKGMSFLEKQYSRKKKNAKFPNITELENEINTTTTTTKTIPLLLNGLQDGQFSARAILDVVPKRYYKLSIEMRGFTVEVKFDTEPGEKLNRFFKSSFKTKSPIAVGRQGSVIEDFRSTCELKSQQATIIKTTNYKLTLPIYADLSTLIFDWNSEMKTLNISGKVKGCSHFLDTPSSESAHRSKVSNVSFGRTKHKRTPKCPTLKSKQDLTFNAKTMDGTTSKAQKEFLAAFNCCNSNRQACAKNNSTDFLSE